MSSVLKDHSYCIINDSPNNNLSEVEKSTNSFDEPLFSSAITSEIKTPPSKKNVRLCTS